MRELSSDILAEITKRLAESIHPEKIYLFGSHAAGNADLDSDVDLLAVVPDTEKSTRQITHQGRASLWGLKIPVDLIVCTHPQLNKWRDVKCHLFYTVVRKGRVLYES